jgi:GT2 family glycosyltransferase
LTHPRASPTLRDSLQAVRARAGKDLVASSVTVVVLNWNRPDDTLACLASLEQVRYSPLEVVVVDNASADDSVARIAAAYPRVQLIRNDANLGFAEGNNVGIRHALRAGADYVMLLNNDAVIHPDCVAALVAAAQAHPQAGFLGAKIFYHADPARIWMGKPVWDARTCRFEHVGLNLNDAEAGLTQTGEASYACGCALMATRHALETAGLMDPRFFCYFEEIDWCFRAAAQGFRSLYVPDAKVWHKVSQSTGGGQTPLVCYFRARNRLLWAEGHLTVRQRWRVLMDGARAAHAGLGWREHGLVATVRRAYWNLLVMRRDPALRAWRHGIRDYALRRFGNAPAAIRNAPRGR